MAAFRVPLAREGWPYIGTSLLPVLLALLLGWSSAALVLLVFPLGFAFFFRDPERRIVETDQALVSPADGRVVAVEPVPAHGHQIISIFLSPLNVHVNRSPLTCRVESVQRRTGVYLPAYDPRAAHENAHIELLLQGSDFSVVLRQVAGIAARRVVSWVDAGDHLRIGERFGIMKFGSRIDMELPLDLRVMVRPGDRVRAAETILALTPWSAPEQENEA